MTNVYEPFGGSKPLSAKTLAAWANKVHCEIGGAKRPVFTPEDFETGDRLKGNHCDCGTDDKGFSLGEFQLMPLDSDDVISGMKAYMVCRKCGCMSHL